jgi:hypothetical protein
MRTNYYVISALPICFALWLLSCTKTVNVVGAQGSQGPQGAPGGSDSSTGNIQGQVQLYDVLGNALADNSGATISIENSSPLIETNSATGGSFLISSVHSGYYDLDVQKTGFGTMRILNFQNSGGPQASQTGILSTGQKLDSPYNIQLIVDTASFGSSQVLNITIKLAHPQITNNPVLLFFSDNPNVSNASSLYTYRNSYYQQDDSTLTFTGFDEQLSAFSDRLNATNYLYISAAIDNVRPLFYSDEQGIVIYPCAGNLSNVVKVYNVLKN